ncbi:MAG: hypothetical protein AAF599_07580, partial [Bacteroidota bacterium]
MNNTHSFPLRNTNFNHFGLCTKILSLFFLIAFSYTLSAQETIWNGSQSSNWGNSSNWSNGVPGSNDQAIIRSSNNDPIIDDDGEIILSHLRIEGGTLTITEEEIVTIKRVNDFNSSFRISNIGIRPGATLINSGRITIEGNPDHETEYGIWNNGGTVINNEPAGNLSNSGIIDIVGLDVLDNAIENVGTFTNEGNITAEGYQSNGIRVEEQGIFDNESGSSIELMGAKRGIRISGSANFTNTGTITIEDALFNGIRVEDRGVFDNESGSFIESMGANSGIEINDRANFTNTGTITVEDALLNGMRVADDGTFTNNNLINIRGGDFGILVRDNSFFTNKGTLNIDGSIDIGLNLQGTEFINDVDATININQRFEETTSVGITTSESMMFENKGGTIRIGGIKRIDAQDIARFIQAGGSSIFANSQGGLIYLGIAPTNISDAIAIFGNASFFNAFCAGIVNSSNYEIIYNPDVGEDPSFGNNGWIISYSDITNSITDNDSGTIINFGNGAFNILNDPNILPNSDPFITQDVFCFGAESIEFSSYSGIPSLSFCFDLVFKRLDNGETNTTGIFNDLQPGQSYDFEISYGGEAVDTFTYDVNSLVDDTPPTLDCTSESFTFDLEDDPSPTLTLDDLTTSDPTDFSCSVATFEIQGYGASRTFGCEDGGSNTLTVVAIDQAGNANTCTVDVEILGAYPEFSFTNDLDIYLDETGVATLSDDDLGFGANLSTLCFTQSEAEANYSVPIAFQNLDCDDIGTTTFLLDSADPNFPPTNQTITVIDTTPVRASVADVNVMLGASGVGTLDESDLVFTVSDNCFTDAEIEAGYSIPNEFRTLDCTQIGTLFITLDKSNPEFPEVVLQVTVESTDLSFDPVSTDFCANFGFDLTS